jgi:hypothetical protein
MEGRRVDVDRRTGSAAWKGSLAVALDLIGHNAQYAANPNEIR